MVRQQQRQPPELVTSDGNWYAQPVLFVESLLRFLAPVFHDTMAQSRQGQRKHCLDRNSQRHGFAMKSINDWPSMLRQPVSVGGLCFFDRSEIRKPGRKTSSHTCLVVGVVNISVEL
jgi:hypothetical protein